MLLCYRPIVLNGSCHSCRVANKKDKLIMFIHGAVSVHPTQHTQSQVLITVGDNSVITSHTHITRPIDLHVLELMRSANIYYRGCCKEPQYSKRD